MADENKSEAPSKEAKGLMKVTKDVVNDYMVKELVSDFSKVPEDLKLTIFQKTPQKFIKKRKIAGGKEFAYIPHQYAEKVLNCIFNFNVSNDVVREEYVSYTEEYMEKQKDGKYIKKTRQVTEAECTMKFTMKRQNGETLIRTVKSSHKGYPNPATTRGDIMKSAYSKAWTMVAHTFGIGTELEQDLAERNVIEEEEAPAPKQVVKTFVANEGADNELGY